MNLLPQLNFKSETTATMNPASHPHAPPPPETSLLDPREDASALRLSLQNLKAQHAAVLDASPDAIISVDPAGKIREWNLAAERIFGHLRRKALGHNIDNLLLSPTRRKVPAQSLVRRLVHSGEHFVGRTFDVLAVRSGGEEFFVEVVVGILAAGDPPLTTAFVRDISDRKNAEDALRRAQATRQILTAAGALGFLEKQTSAQVLAKAIREVAKGNSFYSPSIAKRLQDAAGRSSYAIGSGVVEMLVAGSAAASACRLSPRRFFTSGKYPPFSPNLPFNGAQFGCRGVPPSLRACSARRRPLCLRGPRHPGLLPGPKLPSRRISASPRRLGRW